MIKTTETLAALSAIGALMARNAFRPLESNDRMAFMEAEEDAQIAFDGPDAANALLEMTGERVSADKDAVAVLVSGNCVEFHGHSPEGDPVSAILILETL